MTKEAPKIQVFHALQTHDKQTLSAALRDWMNKASWNAIKKIILSRRVQINGNLCVDDARRLKVGEVIRVLPKPMPKPIDADRVNVAYIDDHIVVFEKPAGVTSVRHFEERQMHVRRRQRQPTLQELAPVAIARKLYQLRHAHPDVDNKRRKPRSEQEIEALIKSAARRHRVVAVHRLDRDTSGLIMFARTKEAALALGRMFRKHEVDRRYTAVVLGDCPAQTLVSYMVRDRGDGRRGSIAIKDGMVPEEARRAVTHVRPVQSFVSKASGDAPQAYTVVECKLETGRTHQIRIHLSEASNMICGEPIYNRTLTGQIVNDPSRSPRQALHAGGLRFVHPISGEKIALKMALPHELQRWLDRLMENVMK